MCHFTLYFDTHHSINSHFHWLRNRDTVHEPLIRFNWLHWLSIESIKCLSRVAGSNLKAKFCKVEHGFLSVPRRPVIERGPPSTRSITDSLDLAHKLLCNMPKTCQLCFNHVTSSHRPSLEECALYGLSSKSYSLLLSLGSTFWWQNTQASNRPWPSSPVADWWIYLSISSLSRSTRNQLNRVHASLAVFVLSMQWKSSPICAVLGQTTWETSWLNDTNCWHIYCCLWE